MVGLREHLTPAARRSTRSGYATVATSDGEFARVYLYLFTISRGSIARIELLELEQVGAALARFEELRAAGRRPSALLSLGAGPLVPRCPR